MQTSRSPRRAWHVGASMILLAMLTACGGPADDIVGVWEADDGTGIKTINDDGSCSGMYYNAGEPLDIGGPMSCSFSEEEDGEGRHALVVQQPPNQQTLEVEFVDADTVEVYQGADRLFTMQRR